MLATRVIPCLLLQDKGLVKTVKFKDPTYIGDPINAVKIFNEKEVDELIFLDIKATAENRKPNFEYIRQIASECFMPLCYGGGVSSTEDIKTLLRSGVEKVAINTHAVTNPEFIKLAARCFGSSTIVAAIDYKKNWLGKTRVTSKSAKDSSSYDPVAFAKLMEEMGAGEIMLNSVDRDGTMAGYDIELLKKVADSVSIPVIACGGAGSVDDFVRLKKEAHISAVAAGSMFVFQGKYKAVLINFPERKELAQKLG